MKIQLTSLVIYSVDISFTLGDGDGGSIFPNLSHSLTLPDGVTFDATTPLPEEWNTIETTQEYKLNIASGFTQGDIIIKLGELTQKIWLSVDAGIVTDYTDYEVVNEITSSSYAVGKSIFDPSPLGFKVPIIGVFSNFNDTTLPGSSNPTNPGHTYNGFVYFPTSGTLDATTKTLNYSRSRGYLWYALAKDSRNAVYLGMYTGSMNVQASYFRTAGLPIRPVQE